MTDGASLQHSGMLGAEGRRTRAFISREVDNQHHQL